MPTTNYEFDWVELAFASKKPLKDLRAILIAAPREISDKRFAQLVKEHLQMGNIVLGLAKERFIDGFDGQPQFRALQMNPALQKIIDKVNASSSQHKIYTLHYFQRELPYILEKVPFIHVIFVNGSWKYVFHSSPSYYNLTSQRMAYEMVSPFINEREARDYEENVTNEIIQLLDSQTSFRGEYTERELLDIANKSATRSFDYGFQTGLSLGGPLPSQSGKYKLLISTYNKVVPFQTYALHYGAAREKYFSPPNDLNHYDTVHAEVMLLLEVQKAKKDLHKTVLFINLLPCPACAHMLAETDIEEFVYSIDHSDGHAIQVLEAAGKKVRRIVLPPQPAL